MSTQPLTLPADPADRNYCVVCDAAIQPEYDRCEPHQMLADLEHDELATLAAQALNELARFDRVVARRLAPLGVLA